MPQQRVLEKTYRICVYVKSFGGGWRKLGLALDRVLLEQGSFYDRVSEPILSVWSAGEREGWTAMGPQQQSRTSARIRECAAVTVVWTMFTPLGVQSCLGSLVSS